MNNGSLLMRTINEYIDIVDYVALDNNMIRLGKGCLIADMKILRINGINIFNIDLYIDGYRDVYIIDVYVHQLREVFERIDEIRNRIRIIKGIHDEFSKKIDRIEITIPLSFILGITNNLWIGLWKRIPVNNLDQVISNPPSIVSNSAYIDNGLLFVNELVTTSLDRNLRQDIEEGLKRLNEKVEKITDLLKRRTGFINKYREFLGSCELYESIKKILIIVNDTEKKTVLDVTGFTDEYIEYMLYRCRRTGYEIDIEELSRTILGYVPPGLVNPRRNIPITDFIK